MTGRDAYWGAKVVTSFLDPQLAAVVAVSGLPGDAAAHVERALRQRRDAIGRTFLRDVTAAEEPKLSPSGTEVCFVDLAIARGYAAAHDAQYAVDVRGLDGTRLVSTEVPAAGTSTCAPVGPAKAHPDYRIMQLMAAYERSRPSASRAAPTRFHLRWRRRGASGRRGRRTGRVRRVTIPRRRSSSTLRRLVGRPHCLCW